MTYDWTEFTKAPWMAVPPERLEPMASVPTMLAREEQRLYYWLTSVWSGDHGEVVELGSYVGGSTARLAAGLFDTEKLARVFAYDHFRTDENTKQNVLYKHGIPEFDGDDILPLAQKLLKPWNDRIVYRRGPIESKTWKGGPIEILAMDASKSVHTMDRMSEIFFPHLIPGRSLVVQQDYYHWRQPWVPAQMRRMANWFTPIAFCPNDTVIFLNTRKVTPAALEQGRIEGLDDAALQLALRRTIRLSPSWSRAYRIRKMIRAVAANPGVRSSYEMIDPELSAKSEP